MEDVIDIDLERHGSVHKIKGHDEVFKVSIADLKSGLSLISIGYMELVKGGQEVDLREVLGSLKSV